MCHMDCFYGTLMPLFVILIVSFTFIIWKEWLISFSFKHILLFGMQNWHSIYKLWTVRLKARLKNTALLDLIRCGFDRASLRR